MPLTVWITSIFVVSIWQSRRTLVTRALFASIPRFQYSVVTMMILKSRTNDSRKVPAIGMLLMLSLLVVAVSVPSLADVVSFPDPGLEAAIRDALAKPTGNVLDTDLVSCHA